MIIYLLCDRSNGNVLAASISSGQDHPVPWILTPEQSEQWDIIIPDIGLTEALALFERCKTEALMLHTEIQNTYSIINIGRVAPLGLSVPSGVLLADVERK
jgi:hypothetical protein